MRRSPRPVISQEKLARLAGGVGVLFVLVAGVDVLLIWYPTSFGNREWEFGTVSASFNGLLSITFGFALIQVWLAHLQRAWPLRVLGFVHIVVALMIIAAVFVYARNISIALTTATAGGAGVGIMKAVIKTSFQSIAFPIAFLLMARLSFLWARRIGRAIGRDKDKGRIGVIPR